MAMVPTSAMMAPAAAASAGSNPFTSALGAGLGAGAASMAGDLISGKSVNFRGKYARNKLKHDQKIWKAQQEHHLSTIGPNMAEHMKALDAAGLHRLSALGITPSQGSTSSSNQPMIPGQSDFGSAVETGINTAINVSDSNRQNAANQAFQKLMIEEQSLRNDWLRTQIANSKLKTLGQITNATQDIPLESLTGKPHSGHIVVTEQPGTPHTGTNAGYSLFGPDIIRQKPGVVRGQALEDAVGEIPAAVISPFQFMQDIGYTLDEMLRQNYENTKTSPYKGMGKTGYTK